MNWTLIGLVLIPLAIAAGQILFKLASATAGPMSLASIAALFLNPWFLAAVALYGTATIAWIFVLKGTDVGRAYQFMALTFVAVPVGAWLVFGEVVTPRQMAGMAIVALGISITQS